MGALGPSFSETQHRSLMRRSWEKRIAGLALEISNSKNARSLVTQRNSVNRVFLYDCLQILLRLTTSAQCQFRRCFQNKVCPRARLRLQFVKSRLAKNPADCGRRHRFDPEQSRTRNA